MSVFRWIMVAALSCLMSCASPQRANAEPNLEDGYYLGSTAADAVLVPGVDRATPAVNVSPEPIITTRDFASVEEVWDPTAGAALRIRFTARGQQALGAATTSHVGGTLNLIVGGQIVSSAIIAEPVTGPDMLLLGIGPEMARDLARRLATT